jgi:serine protease Do
VALKLPTDRAGVYIDGVESGGAAGLAHLKRGDVIVSLGDRTSTTHRALRRVGTVDRRPRHRADPAAGDPGNQTRILYLERYWLTVDGPEAAR